MNIRSASFVKSSIEYSQCPETEKNEYAFIGRSNVGKSSLINMLVNNSKLAMTSSKPGKTLLINHFLVNGEWHLVDLPGYGFAQVSKEVRSRLEPMIKGYILNREQLANLFLLIDSRHEPQQVDLDFMTFLGENGVPFSIVFTKSDKLSNLQLKNNVDDYKKKLLEFWEELPPIFITSSEKKIGRNEILDYIEKINNAN